jgi:hypothetical protein
MRVRVAAAAVIALTAVSSACHGDGEAPRYAALAAATTSAWPSCAAPVTSAATRDDPCRALSTELLVTYVLVAENRPPPGILDRGFPRNASGQLEQIIEDERDGELRPEH